MRCRRALTAVGFATLGSFAYFKKPNVCNNGSLEWQTKLQDVSRFFESNYFISKLFLSAIAESSDKSQTQGNQINKIYTDLLIPGKGEPLKNMLVITENNKIVFVGKMDNQPHSCVSCVFFVSDKLTKIANLRNSKTTHNRKTHITNYRI